MVMLRQCINFHVSNVRRKVDRAALGASSALYLGKELGPLSQLHHGVKGTVYAVDSRTLYLHDFHYDGAGPAAYFYVGSSKSPSAAGAIRLRDERGGGSPLRRYRGEGLTLSLPDGKTLRDVTWFSVWCDEYSVNFGSVSIPANFEYPKPAKLSALRGVHAVSSDPVVVVDAQTLLIPNFSYDGEAPDAKFWVGRGEKPSPQGIRIPDENGKETPLRKYDKKTIVLTLPGELTVFDIGHFAVWCEAFTVNFGHIPLPRSQLSNVPPSLKMLGVSPQSRNKELAEGAAPARPGVRPTPPRRSKPIARLDATTYRPSRLGAGPLVALLEQADPHSHHRRANNYSPFPDQLLANPKTQSKDQYRQRDGIQNGSNEQEERYKNQQNIDYAQGVNHRQHEQSQQTENENYRRQQLQNLYHKELLDRQNQELLYQQQLYEQQRRAYEQELQNQQYLRQPEPYRYQLLPYAFGTSQGQRDNHEAPGVVTIQRSIDLDPVTGSRPQ
ncbi:unnamed protein product, partial [Iphiclides podalirius]